jgi:hypothetical protein
MVTAELVHYAKRKVERKSKTQSAFFIFWLIPGDRILEMVGEGLFLPMWPGTTIKDNNTPSE